MSVSRSPVCAASFGLARAALYRTALCVLLLVATVGVSAQQHAHPHAATAAKLDPKPSGPTVVIDTTLGRITCTLFNKQAPITSANFIGLATGTKDWTDNSTGTVTHGKLFYDGVAFNGVTDGVIAGDRLGGGRGLAGPAFPAEKSGIGFDRAGRLVMSQEPSAKSGDKSAPGMTSGSLFLVLEHADAEYQRPGNTVFGQCDEASLPVVSAISHTLLTTDNHPDAPLAINHITVLEPGNPPPPVAAGVDAASITPQPRPAPSASIPSPDPTGPTAVIEVASNGSPGTLTCRLFKDETPIAMANFIGLANGTKDWKSPKTHALMHGKRFYDGLSFRRVIPDFMIQNADLPGDPDGDGDIGFHFANEIVPGLTFDRPGRLAYANAGPGTNDSEFFITEHPNHRLDGNFTIFGQCDEASVKLVEMIARVPRDEHNRPLAPVIIRRITITPAGK